MPIEFATFHNREEVFLSKNVEFCMLTKTLNSSLVLLKLSAYVIFSTHGKHTYLFNFNVYRLATNVLIVHFMVILFEL